MALAAQSRRAKPHQQRPDNIDGLELLMWMMARTDSQAAPYGLDQPCRVWNGAAIKDGYGTLAYKGPVVLAHRLAFALYNEVPLASLKGLICHHCDVPGCIEPTHLMEGTDAINAAHKVKRGRMPSVAGEANPAALLTFKQVTELRQSPLSVRKTAKVFGVSKSLVSAIRNNHIWKQAACGWVDRQEPGGAD